MYILYTYILHPRFGEFLVTIILVHIEHFGEVTSCRAAKIQGNVITCLGPSL